MPDELEKPELKDRPSKRELGPGHVRIWANDAQIGHSPWDVTVTFGQLRRADAEMLEVEQQATVYMSPQFAQRLVSALEENLRAYQERFGEIKPPLGTD